MWFCIFDVWDLTSKSNVQTEQPHTLLLPSPQGPRSLPKSSGSLPGWHPWASKNDQNQLKTMFVERNCFFRKSSGSLPGHPAKAVRPAVWTSFGGVWLPTLGVQKPVRVTQRNLRNHTAKLTNLTAHLEVKSDDHTSHLEIKNDDHTSPFQLQTYTITGKFDQKQGGSHTPKSAGREPSLVYIYIYISQHYIYIYII